jgi:hypothetical protein
VKQTPADAGVDYHVHAYRFHHVVKSCSKICIRPLKKNHGSHYARGKPGKISIGRCRSQARAVEDGFQGEKGQVGLRIRRRQGGRPRRYAQFAWR